MMVGSQMVRVPQAGLQFLNSLASRYGGRVLSDLPGKFGAIRPHIDSARQIIFNLGSGIRAGTLLAEEYQYILSRPELLRKTIFITNTPVVW